MLSYYCLLLIGVLLEFNYRYIISESTASIKIVHVFRLCLTIAKTHCRAESRFNSLIVRLRLQGLRITDYDWLLASINATPTAPIYRTSDMAIIDFSRDS